MTETSHQSEAEKEKDSLGTERGTNKDGIFMIERAPETKGNIVVERVMVNYRTK